MRSEAIEERVKAVFEESAALMRTFAGTSAELIAQAAREIAASVSGGGKLLLFGNGGSAADAQHIASEFVNRLCRERPPLPAVALTVDTSILTSIANDYSFADVFSKQIQALGESGDVAVAISTSGDSENVLKAIETSTRIGLKTIGLLGKQGGRAAGMVDFPIVVRHRQTQRIQEVHILIGHILSELVEEILFPHVVDGK